MTLYCEDKFHQAMEILEPCRDMSFHMYQQEKNIVLFKIDYILDTLLIIKILKKLKQLQLAEDVLQELFKEFILTLDTTELNKYSNEHRVIFLIHDDSYLKDNLMMKGIPLVDYNMIQQMFLENAGYFYRVLTIKDEIKFDPRYTIA
jgi:SepF-like predicted cell division protein (DUF552 family)